MNLDEISDINQLKALAYDQVLVREQAVQNLTLINQRISAIISSEQNKKEYGHSTSTKLQHSPQPAPDSHQPNG